MNTLCDVRMAASAADLRHSDTARLRQDYLIRELFRADEVLMTYTMHDRLIVGGAMPVGAELPLSAVSILRADYFLQRREIGIINVGSAGSIIVDDTPYDLGYKEALYVGRGIKRITFRSKDAAQPALFYFNSAPAHRGYPTAKVTTDSAVVLRLGTKQECNERVVNRMLVQEVLPTCQLQMGLTELADGSVWNTMPPHTHERRMEAYFYFRLPQGHAICHFMGEPQETRHLWLATHQAVISPPWSIHSACATCAYSFIWGMAGENLDYTDMDTCSAAALR